MASSNFSDIVRISAEKPETIRFGALFKERRKEARLSQKDLAEMLNVTRNTVINWEADRCKPDYSQLPDICAYLGIKLYELFGTEPENSLSPLEERVVNNLRQLDPASRKAIDKMIYTMLQEVIWERDRVLKETFGIFLKRPGSLAAGVGSPVLDSKPEYVFLRKNHINAKADGIALVDGNSMEPVYHNGDYVYYRNASSADPGEDVVVDTDDGAVIKRVDDDYTLYSVNPNLPYPEKSEQNTLVIRGIVLSVVPSSDMAADEDKVTLEECFVDKIRKFNRQYGINN